MTFTLRQKQWVGALVSIAIQTSIFILLEIFTNHFVSAFFVLVVNVVIAMNYKNANPYFVGARWATFWNLSLASYARHGYWYDDFLASFVRLRDFEAPVPTFEKLCQGDTEAILMIGFTTALILTFYFFVTQWPEWTGRWEMLRRAPFSASLGLQTVIFVTIAYPTAFTITLALTFASIISPLLRRQIRLNHTVFLMLLPLFALGSYHLAIVFALVAGLGFLYFASIERAMSAGVASFNYFLGITFVALFFSLAEARVVGSTSTVIGGLYALLTFALFILVALVLIFKDTTTASTLRNFALRITPAKIKESSWWDIRALWVDREVDHRVNKRYNLKNQKIDLGLFMFGPRAWVEGSENYERKEQSRINWTMAVIVLAFYSIWVLIDAVIGLAGNNSTKTLLALSVGFLIIIATLIALTVRQLRDRNFYKKASLLTSIFSIIVFGSLMTLVIYSGLTNNTALLESGSDNNPTQVNQNVAPGESKYECPCDEDEDRDASVFDRYLENK